MKKQFAVLALAFAVSNAFATSSPNECGNHGNNCNNGGNGSVNPPVTVNQNLSNANSTRNTNQQRQQQRQTANGGTGIGIGGNGFGGAGGEGGAGGSASAGAGASSSADNAGNNQSVTFSSPESSTVKTVGEAPAVIGNPTAPCRIAIGASAGWLGGAFGFGGSVVDESCRRIEVARQLYNMRQTEAAVRVMCNEPEAAAALGEKVCPQPKREPDVVVRY